MNIDKQFYKNKVVLVTGHTGFKGTWLCKILINYGSKVIGYSLNPPTEPNVFKLSKIEAQMVSIIGDIRNYELLKTVFDKYKPEIVFHLAAQPIVLDSYKNPRYTYETNVMGTVNVLECIRQTESVKSFVNVTTDKVYENNDLFDHSFSENEPLNGFDPYSNSKSCSELVTQSYSKAFFGGNRCAISTVRAGNVIGGGDFANDRIIPDAIRAINNNKNIYVRNPNSTRPYQHVLEPLFAYLMLAEHQYKNNVFSGYYNVGPDEIDCVTTGDLIQRFCIAWGKNITWYTKEYQGPHEANYLKLNCDKIKRVFAWSPKWHLDEAIQKIVDWTKVYFENPSQLSQIMNIQIKEYIGE